MIWSTEASLPAAPLLTELTELRSDYDIPATANETTKPRRGLGIILGVFIPTLQSLLGTVIFLRLGWIVGQQGLLVTLGSFALVLLIIIVTTLSISAVVTNERIEGGGVYYIISRSLGPEIGGAIGIAFCLTNSAGVAFNILAFVEILKRLTGDVFGHATTLILSSIVHVGIGSIAVLGPSWFSKISALMLVIMLFSWFCAVVALCFRTSGTVQYATTGFNITGPNWSIFSQNIRFDHYDEGNSFMSVFSLFFTAFVGIVAGTSLSGDLAEPHKSLPRGSFAALATSAGIHLFTMFMLASSIPNEALRGNRLIMQDIQWEPALVYSGILISMAANALSSLVGAARVLQKIGHDGLLPGFHLFATGAENPIRGTIAIFIGTQLVLFMGSIDAVSGILTNFFLLAFASIHLACMALKGSGAPNFRPMFKYSNLFTSVLGFALCIFAMIAIKPLFALISLLFAALVFILVVFTGHPVAWGDVSQAIIYHQVRKYLLKLDERKQHVRNWRPAILALIDDPISSQTLIQFGNDIKKGGLYVVGHFLFGTHEDLVDSGKYHAVRRDWLAFFEQNRVKAFPEISVGTDRRAAARALCIHSGLGAMRPNTVLIGILKKHEDPLAPSQSFRAKFSPSIDLQDGPPIDAQTYMQIVADILKARMSLMMACNFEKLNPALFEPKPKRSASTDLPSKYVDVWLTHDVVRCPDTTTGLMLQMVHVLSTQDAWARLGATVRVLFVVGPSTSEDSVRQEISNQLLHMRMLPPDELLISTKLPAPTPDTKSNVLEQLAELIERESRQSLVTFAPLWPMQDNVADSQKSSEAYLTDLRNLTNAWGATVLVHGAQSVVSF